MASQQRIKINEKKHMVEKNTNRMQEVVSVTPLPHIISNQIDIHLAFQYSFENLIQINEYCKEHDGVIATLLGELIEKLNKSKRAFSFEERQYWINKNEEALRKISDLSKNTMIRLQASKEVSKVVDLIIKNGKIKQFYEDSALFINDMFLSFNMLDDKNYELMKNQMLQYQPATRILFDDFEK